MLSTALVFGFVASLSSIILFMKLPKRIKDFFYRKPLIAELFSTGFFFFTITSVTSSLVGVMIALMAELMWSASYFVLRSLRS